MLKGGYGVSSDRTRASGLEGKKARDSLSVNEKISGKESAYSWRESKEEEGWCMKRPSIPATLAGRARDYHVHNEVFYLCYPISIRETKT